MGALRSIAMFYASRPAPSGGGTVFGAAVAATTFLKMLDRWGDGLELAAYASGDDVARSTRELERAGCRRTRVHAYTELFGRAGVAPSVWHDMGADVIRPFQLRSARAARLYPITVTPHTVSYSFQLHDWYLPLLLGDVRACDSILCTSHAMRRAIANNLAHVAGSLERSHGLRVAFRGRLDMLPLGVDTEKFRPQPRAALRRKLGLPVDRPIVLWVGRLSAADKADLLPLVGVFADIVRTSKQKPLLVIAGTDRRFDSEILRDYAAKLGIARSVRVVTGLDPSVRHRWFAAADVFASPVDNIQETFGLTPIEAMACGTPVVVSDWDGYRDTVVDGEVGFRVPTAWARCDREASELGVLVDGMLDHLALAQSVVVDPAVLRARLAQLIEDEPLRARMGAAARAHAVASYGWDRVIPSYVALWRQLARRTGGPFRRRAAEYTRAPFFAAFGHYAARTLGARTVVAVTPEGRETLAGRRPLPVYHMDGVVLVDDLLEIGLERLARRERRGGALGALAKELARAGAVSEEKALRHLLWLVKYGLAAER